MSINRLKYGLFFLCMALLLYELTLIRVFSTVLFYHFAFMAIGVAMLGLAAGGLTVHLKPQVFPREKVYDWSFWFSLGFSLFCVISLWVIFKIPVNAYSPIEDITPKLTAIYIISFIPFYFAGIVLAAIFSNFPEKMGQLYAFDLIGAGIGAVLVIPLMNIVGGESAVLYVSAIALVATSLLSGKRWKIALILGAVVLLLGFTNSHYNWIKIRYTKGMLVEDLDAVYDKWNSFSRVMVIPFRLGTDAAPQTWCPSPRYMHLVPTIPHKGVRHSDFFSIMIDDGASTPILPFDGKDYSKLQFLKYDLTSLAHRLRGDGVTLVIGSGGGRDVLTGLVLGAKRIDAVDINPLMFKILEGPLRDYSGDLFNHERVRGITAEGRAFARRNPLTYDLIQVAMIDTWASTTAGAYSLSENSLYTVEAFKDYLSALKPGGILSFTRFYFTPPREALRLASLFIETAEQLGMPDPSGSIMVAMYNDLSTLIFKKGSFSEEEIAQFTHDVEDMGFHLIYTPLFARDRNFHSLINARDKQAFYDNYPYDVSPPVDDSPFFFNMLKVRDFLKAFEEQEGLRFNYYATYTLVIVFILSIVATLVTLILPMLFQGAWVDKFPGRGYLLGYFVMIGLAYLLIEIALLQRFSLLLEHPAYAASAVIAGFLVSSGLGSLLWGNVSEDYRLKLFNGAFLTIILFMIIHIFGGGSLIYSIIHLPLWIKGIIAMLLILPLGFAMGIPLPAGITIAGQHSSSTVAWCWAVNGAASVLASSFAMVLAMSKGFSVVLKVGMFCYLMAFTFMSIIIFLQRKGSISKVMKV